MLHFQENGSTMPTAGTAPEKARSLLPKELGFVGILPLLPKECNAALPRKRLYNAYCRYCAGKARSLLPKVDDLAGKLHTFRRWERAERKENAATDAVADIAR